MDKLKLHTPDLTAQNIEKLATLFPNCVTETTDAKGKLKRGIDFDQLRQELSDHVVEGPRERYHLDWPGKREALLAANAPIAKTLRPCREESVDFDTTKNLFIEGDNLDALKLLQETYLGKVKLIYIDPPYNTGNDFIYDDDFAEDAEKYFQRSHQSTDDGQRLVVNTESNGRFHSDWLSMMYSRLSIARNLLAEDGAIFISIDDNELPNLRKVCDQIFGENNFIANIAWKHTQQSKNDERYFSRHYNSIVVYRRSPSLVSFSFPRTEEDNRNYSNPDNDKNGDWRSGDVRSPNYRRTLCYKLETPIGTFIEPPENGWRWSQAEMQKKIASGEVFFSSDHTRIIRKIYLKNQDGRTPENVWSGEDFGTTRIANAEIKALFDNVSVFDTPKPTALIVKIAQLIHRQKDYVVMDFFAGSGTTACGIIALNTKDNGNRKFVVVQIPEPVPTDSLAAQAGFLNIAEITKERIRRAGAKIKAENVTTAPNLDIGFRVLKIDTSNMKDVYYAPDEVKQGQLEMLTDNIKEDRTPEDLLFQVLVDWGVDLALPITQETIAKKKVFFVDGNALAACFDPNITEELVKELAKKKPLRAVFRDSSYGSDSVKINVEQIFKLLSPGTELKSL
jgi:adenine-specific DNA-methyltransferase